MKRITFLLPKLFFTMILLSDGPFNLDIRWHSSGSSHVKYGFQHSGKQLKSKYYNYKWTRSRMLWYPKTMAGELVAIQGCTGIWMENLKDPYLPMLDSTRLFFYILRIFLFLHHNKLLDLTIALAQSVTLSLFQVLCRLKNCSRTK